MAREADRLILHSSAVLTLTTILFAISVLSCVAAPASASPGEILVARSTTTAPFAQGSILRLDPRRGRLGLETADVGAYPADLTFGPEAELYVTDWQEGAVYRVDPRTNAGERVASGGRNFVHPVGIAYSAERRLYVADPANGFRPPNIFRINPATQSQTQLGLGSLLDRPTGVTIAGDGDVIISDAGPAGSADGRLIRLHSGPRGDAARRFDRGARLRQPRGLATAADGSIIVADTRGPNTPGAVVSVSADGRSSRVVARSVRLAEPLDVAVAPSRAIYVLDAGLAPGKARLLRVRRGGRASVLASGHKLDGALGITVEPPRCAGRVATVIGSDGQDRLLGTRFADVIAGLGGEDRISGFNGNDLICGGTGEDRLNGGKGFDRLGGGAGSDRLNGSAGDDRLLGGSGRDLCAGRGGRDRESGCRQSAH